MKRIFEYTGAIVSNNDAKKMHWRTLKKKIDSQKIEFMSIIRNKRKFVFDKFKVLLRYNTRHDPDNLVFTMKTFIDQLKINGRILEDSPKHCRGIAVEPDEQLKKGTLIFEVIQVT